MLHRMDQHNYSSEEWDLMQRAHAKASAILHRCPKTHENANRLARTVMRLFDQGLHDELLIATQAVVEEVTVTNIWSQRDSAVLKAVLTETMVKASNDNR